MRGVDKSVKEIQEDLLYHIQGEYTKNISRLARQTLMYLKDFLLEIPLFPFYFFTIKNLEVSEK